MAVLEAVIDPDSFMERRADDRRQRKAVGLVALLGALGALGPLYYAYLIREVVENPTDTFPYQLLAVVLVPFVMVFSAWIGYAVVSHLLSRAYGGRGRFRPLLELTAWALLPLGIGYFVRSVGLVAAFRSMSREGLSTEVAGADPGREVLVGFEAGIGEPAAVIGTVAFAASILWSGYLLSFAVKHAEGVPWRDAVKVAAVPSVAYALYELVDGLLAAGLL